MVGSLEVIFGPPGTGKTTELARLALDYGESEGSDTLLLCAYTQTAARELAGRELPIEKSHMGTLHSLTFHALDSPPIAETHYKEWNAAYPKYQLSSAESSLDIDTVNLTSGDTLLALVNLLRNRMIPPEQWTYKVANFWPLWSAWKHDTGYQDFTDLIDKARVLLPVAPGNPQTIIVDEGQDLSLLQWSLLNHWSKHAVRVIVAGDDEQCLYRHVGADFRPLLAAPLRRVLPQSYRVPRTHQALAQRYSTHIRTKEPKTWAPRPVDGVLRRASQDWHQAEWWVRQAGKALEADSFMTYTFLAPCGYMLHPLLIALRAAGLPFGNRWRLKRHDWNPLAPPRHGTSTVQRLLDFLRPSDRLWTWRELATWIPLVRTDDVLTAGAKTEIVLRAKDKGVCTQEDLVPFFAPGQLAAAVTGDLSWLEAHAMQPARKAMAYPCRVLRKYGREALTEEPRLRVGTGHSFKGTGSDMVVYFNDLSRSQQMALCHGRDDADDIWRMRYVAVTRSSETLIVAGGIQ